MGERRYQAYKITFKFPAEHSIDGNPSEAEMKIHHKSEDVRIV